MARTSERESWRAKFGLSELAAIEAFVAKYRLLRGEKVFAERPLVSCQTW